MEEVDEIPRSIEVGTRSTNTTTTTPTDSTPSTEPPASASPPGEAKPSAEDIIMKSDSAEDDTKAAIPNEAEEEVEEKEDLSLDQEEEILLGVIPKANMVGLKHYRGINNLKKGQSLELKRDPQNVHDRNALEIRHYKGNKIGNLSKRLAGLLSPLVDRREITLEGTVVEVPSHTTLLETHPVQLSIYGPRKLTRDARLEFLYPEKIKARKRKAEMLLAEEEESRRGSKEGSAFLVEASGEGEEGEVVRKREGEGKAEMDALMHASIQINSSTSSDVLAELFKEGSVDPSLLMIHPCPPGKKDKSMRSDLMEFQKQGLAWMCKMEHPELPTKVEDPPSQLWVYKLDEKNNPFYYHLATGDTQRNKPVLKRGGILADEMGLGKTMQTIALIMTDDTGVGVLAEPEEPDDRYDDLTLIVCPLSVASNWTDQFHTHVGSKRVKWHLYHGEGRGINKKTLRKFDVIITTYQTLAQERFLPPPPPPPSSTSVIFNSFEPPSKKVKLDPVLTSPTKLENGKESVGYLKPVDGLLHSIKWRRIVLDEGHVIKNPKAKMSLACADLKAERRWILTGTPIINSTNDLGAMITFLKMCRPLDEREKWNQYISGPIKAGDEQGPRLLRAVVSSTTLRRTKDMTNSRGELLVSLPEIKFFIHKVKLAPDVRALYDEIAEKVKSVVQVVMKKEDGTSASSMSLVLVYLLRMRQIACDPALCPPSFFAAVRSERLKEEAERSANNQSVGSLEDRLSLQLKSKLATGEECTSCGEAPKDPRIAPCGHVFCLQCAMERVENDSTCPNDYRPFLASQLVGITAEAEEEVDADEEVLASQKKDGLGASMAAAKTLQLIEFLNATEKTQPGTKSLVFSQWTTHLNCIEAALTAAGIVSCRFDGSMTQDRREQVISSFSAPPSKKKPKKGARGQPTVMLISLKAGALGLNLTCASQVFLMDPWWQASIEKQAIDRVYRIGQTKPVKVFQLVAEDTVEDKVLAIQTRKELLISQAFSGNKNAPKITEKIDSRKRDIEDIFDL